MEQTPPIAASSPLQRGLIDFFSVPMACLLFLLHPLHHLGSPRAFYFLPFAGTPQVDFLISWFKAPVLIPFILTAKSPGFRGKKVIWLKRFKIPLTLSLDEGHRGENDAPVLHREDSLFGEAPFGKMGRGEEEQGIE